MNLEGNLENNHVAYACGTFQPRNLREAFDYWWWRHCNQMIVTFGTKTRNPEGEGEKPAQEKKEGETPAQDSDSEVNQIEEIDDDKDN